MRALAVLLVGLLHPGLARAAPPSSAEALGVAKAWLEAYGAKDASKLQALSSFPFHTLSWPKCMEEDDGCPWRMTTSAEGVDLPMDPKVVLDLVRGENGAEQYPRIRNARAVAREGLGYQNRKACLKEFRKGVKRLGKDHRFVDFHSLDGPYLLLAVRSRHSKAVVTAAVVGDLSCE